jgi:hypothetical protein
VLVQPTHPFSHQHVVLPGGEPEHRGPAAWHTGFILKSVFCFSSDWHCIDPRHTQSSIKHYQIKKNDSGQWYITERHLFPSVPELIQYHQYNAAGKCGVRSGGKGWGSVPWLGRHSWSQVANSSKQPWTTRAWNTISLGQWLFSLIISPPGPAPSQGARLELQFLISTRLKMVDDRDCRGNLVIYLYWKFTEGQMKYSFKSL